jgi:(R,R)-butanediol dehydrogenase / meso-butanediol dehydrogenase / diacetyl reductase
MVAWSRRGGAIVLVGLHPAREQLPLLEVVLGERIIRGSAAHVWDEDLAAAVRLLERGMLSVAPMSTHRTSLEQAVEAAFGTARVDVLKVLVDPRKEPDDAPRAGS